MLFRPNYLTPTSGSAIDATLDNNFSCVIQSTSLCEAYKIIILKAEDNTQVYTSGKVTLSPALQDGDTLTVEVPSDSTMTNRDNPYQYKYYFTLYDSADNETNSLEIPFYTNLTPTLTIDSYSNPITSKSNTFTATYTQAQSIPIKNSTWNLYNTGETTPIDTQYQESKQILEYTYDGFINSNSYDIELIVTTQNGIVVSTGTETFSVSYSEPLINLAISLEEDLTNDSLTASWADAYVIDGDSYNSDYDFLEDIMYSGDVSCEVLSGNYLYWDTVNETDLNIPDDFTIPVFLNLKLGFMGDIINIENTSTSKSYVVNYDGSKFNYDIDGTITGEYSDSNATGESYWWKITLLPIEVQFEKIVFTGLMPSESLVPSETLIPYYRPV